MVHEEFFKIAIGVVVALFLGVSIGVAVYFFGKTNGGEMPVVSVQDKGGFPQAGKRALKPYQYPEAKPKSYPQPSPPAPLPIVSPSGSTPQIQQRKPTSGILASPQKIVYPSDYQPDEGSGEGGFDPDKDSEAETD